MDVCTREEDWSKEMDLQHFSHHHPLVAFDVKEGEYLIYCSICNLDVSDLAYVCYECQFAIHRSCRELPGKIDHPFHPIHPLTLTHIEQVYSVEPGGSLNCDACGWKSFTYVYHCSDCSFDLDLFCASLIPKSKDDEEEIRSQIHQHPLTLCDNMSNTLRACSVCELPLERSILVCLPCKIFFHKSCNELPAKMKHPFHLYHPLTLAPCDFSDNDWLPYKCKVCIYPCHGFAYSCLQCKFHVHVACASPAPIRIRTKLHKHPLAFLDIPNLHYRQQQDFPYRRSATIRHEFKCSVCKSLLEEPFFRCVDCDFNLHVNCNPVLPVKIKHRGHVHPLILTNSIIKDFQFEDELDKSIEYYCDSCEQQRRLFDRSYYCKECHYVAHVQCVASELVLSMQLKEDWYFSKKIWKSIVAGRRVLLFFLLVLLSFIISLASRRAQGIVLELTSRTITFAGAGALGILPQLTSRAIKLAGAGALGFLHQLISQTTSIVAVTFISSGFSGCFPSRRHHFWSHLIFILLFLLCKPLPSVVL